jgi:hypothetical protein
MKGRGGLGRGNLGFHSQEAYAATNGKSAICLALFKEAVTILWCFGQVPVRLWLKILA